MLSMSADTGHAESTRLAPTLVLGVGNILLGDEGAGVRVIEEIRKHELPEDVEVVDGGTLQLVLIDIIRGRKKVIVVDAVNGGEPPGSIYRFEAGDLQEASQQIGTVHDLGVVEAVFFLDLMQELPADFVFYGVEPQSFEPSLELTPDVAAALPRLTELVLQEIGINNKGIQTHQGDAQ